MKSEHRHSKMRKEARVPKGSTARSNPKAYEIARRVREQMVSFLKQKDVALQMGCTRARVEQIELEALTKIVAGMLDEGSVFPASCSD